MNFFKIYVYQPNFVAGMRGMFEKGININNVIFPNRTFESNMPYALRFMVDQGIVGMGWLKINANSFKIRPKAKMISRC